MAIQYPSAGTIYYTQFSCTSIQVICDAIKDALVVCGWAHVNDRPSTVFWTFNGQPSNTQTCVIDGLTYTFKTTINNGNPREILIDTTAALTASNFKECINNGTGSGTKFSSATTAHPYVTATISGSVVTTTSTGTGFDANSKYVVSNGLSNVTISATTSHGRGYEVRMPATPQGLRAGVILDDPGSLGTNVRIRVTSSDFTTVVSGPENANPGAGASGCWSINVSGGRTLEFCGNAHQFFIWLLGDTATAGTKFWCTVPAIRDHNIAATIIGATNATPIVIQTSAVHGLITGDHVFIADVLGNTAANGYFTVTYVDTTHVSLDTSVGSGAYTSGGRMASNSQLSRCILAAGDTDGSGAYGSFRLNGNGSASNFFVCHNQYSYAYASGGSPAVPGLVGLQQLHTSFVRTYTWGMIPDLLEPRISCPVASNQGAAVTFGSFWAAFMVMESNVMDRINTGFDSHNWINYTSSDTIFNTSLWLAKS